VSQIGIVIDDKYSCGLLGLPDHLGLACTIFRGTCFGFSQKNTHGGALADVAVDEHGAAGLACDAIDLAQTETGSFSPLFGGEKRIEGSRNDLRRHTRTRILDRKLCIVSGLQPYLVQDRNRARTN